MTGSPHTLSDEQIKLIREHYLKVGLFGILPPSTKAKQKGESKERGSK